MRLTGIAMVKNESDIIESFVRHNLGLLDRLYVVDNGSTDTTMAILAALAEELPGLTVERDPDPAYVQEQKLTAVARDLAAKEPFDFLLPIDADEFLRCASRAVLEGALAALPPKGCGAIPWVTYVPTPGDDAAEPDPVRRIRYHRESEPETLLKVAVPAALVAQQDFRLWPGNHYVDAGGVIKIERIELEGVSLAHYPVRSSEQLASKILLGEWSLRLKSGRGRLEGLHWRKLAEHFERDPRITSKRASDIAAAYTRGGSPELALVLDPLVLAPTHRLAMPGRIEVDLLKRVVSFAARHFADQARTVIENDYMAVARTSSSVMAYPKADTVVGRSLRLYGEWAENELLLLLQLVGPGHNVVDVGACIGTHAVRFAQRVAPGGVVHAFEPQRLVHQMLCANAALNGLTNLHAHRAAVADSEGDVKIAEADPARPRNVGKFRIGAARGGETVRQVTLDAMKLPGIRLIKVDVEGMEERVLRGATRLIARDRPILFVENNIPERSESLLRAIAALGYRAWWHFEPYYNPENYYGNPENFLAGVRRPEINILALPEGAGISPHPALVPVRDPAQTWEQAHSREVRRTSR
jgi:FkbM family methyltransferase